MRALSVLLKGFMTMMIFAAATQSWGKLEIPSLIGDHMVFQQGMPAMVWGKDKAGQKIVVSIAGQSAPATADSKGDWKAQLPDLPVGGPYELTIAGSESVTFQDVLVGEVWVASGQSNMELAMSITHDAAKSIPQAVDAKIHFFTQSRASSGEPVKNPVGSWQVCSPDTIKPFSAVAYHFGRNLRQALDVPVGLIGSYWGGSFIESWIPDEKLKSSPDFKPELDRWAAKPEVEKEVWAKGAGMELEISGLRFIPQDPSAKPVTVLMKPDTKPGKTFGGTWAGNAMTGSTIGFTSNDGGGRVPGPIGIVKGQFTGGAWGSVFTNLNVDGTPTDLSSFKEIEFYAKGRGQFRTNLSQPSITDWDEYASEPFDLTKEWKLHNISISSLKQGGWGSPKPYTPAAVQGIFFGVVTPGLSEVPSALYNGMIAPLTPLRIRGVIWYQGESNADRGAEYQKLLPALIQSWREVWNEGDFPFLYLQLPNFMAVQPEPSQSGWAELREAQLMTLKTRKTGMAVLIDLGEANDIHPKNKTDVGYRLAQAALP
ncbi:MAG TPA: sialate O-acetylesterase, partial [bacterium]